MTAKKASPKPKKAVVAVSKANTAALVQEQQNKLARQAYIMRQQGESWWTIAEKLKITERQASMLVADAISAASALVDEGAKQMLLSMEIDRLDTLQRAVWPDAISGDLKAVETALRIIQARAKVLGLDNIQTGTVTNNTIVVAGTSEDYISALRRVVEIPAYEEDS